MVGIWKPIVLKKQGFLEIFSSWWIVVSLGDILIANNDGTTPGIFCWSWKKIVKPPPEKETKMRSNLPAYEKWCGLFCWRSLFHKLRWAFLRSIFAGLAMKKPRVKHGNSQTLRIEGNVHKNEVILSLFIMSHLIAVRNIIPVAVIR